MEKFKILGFQTPSAFRTVAAPPLTHGRRIVSLVSLISFPIMSGFEGSARGNTGPRPKGGLRSRKGQTAPCDAERPLPTGHGSNRSINKAFSSDARRRPVPGLGLRPMVPAVIVALALGAFIRPADAIWYQAVRYTNAQCSGAIYTRLCPSTGLFLTGNLGYPRFGRLLLVLSAIGAPFEVIYTNSSNYASCSQLLSTTCREAKGANGTKAVYESHRLCSETRPTNWSMSYPPNMDGNYMVATSFKTPFAFFIDVQQMCCDLPVMEYAVRLNASGLFT